MTEGEPRPEPRGMTLTDAMMLSVGVAAAFGIMRGLGDSGFVPMVSPLRMMILLGLLIVWGIACGVTAVALGRSARFRRWLEPGERMAALLTAVGITAIRDGRSDPFDRFLVQTYDLNFTQARWLVASGWTLVLLAGLPLLLALRRPGLRWIHGGFGLILTIVAVRGPLLQVARDGPLMLVPAGGFSQTPVGLLVIQMLERVASTPFGLLVAFPSVAVLAAFWQRRRGPWTAWVGPWLAWPVLLYELLLRPTFFPPGAPLWFADRGFCLLWTTGEWWFAGRVLRRWDRPQRGIGSPAEINSAT